MAGAPADYVDVAERIREFKRQYPEGSLQAHLPPYITEAGGKAFVVYSAAAYRTPDDPRPGIGYAWEPVPGRTNFTRDSELMNAETSAWGRAIVALGFETKHIASANEVRNRRDDTPAPAPAAQPPAAQQPRPADTGSQFQAPVVSEQDVKDLWELVRTVGMPDAAFAELVTEITGKASTKTIPVGKLADIQTRIEAWKAAA